MRLWVDSASERCDQREETIDFEGWPAVSPVKPADAHATLRRLLAVRLLSNPTKAKEEAARILLGVCGTSQPDVWAELVSQAEYHGLVPLLEPLISCFAADFPTALPLQVRRSFAALSSRHKRVASARETCIDALLVAFANAGLRTILLKGAALAHLIYPDPGQRPMVDVDVLVDRSDLAQAAEVLRRLGFSFAPCHTSRLGDAMHHLPAASVPIGGFRIVLELHHDAMSPNQSERLTFASLASEPTEFRRSLGPAGLALGHTDMLRHLTRHTFEPAQHVRLQLLYDLVQYWRTFVDQIDRDELARRFPYTLVGLQLARLAFDDESQSDDPATTTRSCGRPMSGVGMGLVPLSQVANVRFRDAAAALFNPSPWWLHGFYGVPIDTSLFYCRAIRHPLTLARWLTTRALANGRSDPSDASMAGKNEDESPPQAPPEDSTTQCTMDIFPRHAASFESDQADDELLLYRAADRTALCLNVTAAAIWHLCDGNRAVREIIDELSQGHREVVGLANQVVATLTQFHERGALTFHSKREQGAELEQR
jgi:hypothetical protein